MTRKPDSRETRFKTIICSSQGQPDKHVSDPVATVDSKIILLGPNANWTCRWKFIEDLEIDKNSLSWTYKGDQFICREAESQTWEAFLSRISRYWKKRQTKDSWKNEAPSRIVSSTSTKRRRIAYGSRNRRSRVTSSYKQSKDPMWSSDEGEDPGNDDVQIEESMENLPTNKGVNEDDPQSPNHQVRKPLSDESYEGEDPGNDDAQIEESMENLTTNKGVNDNDPQSPNHQVRKPFSDESSTDDGPSRPQRLKRLKKKRTTNVIRDADDADDSDTFPAEEMTTPATQRVVSPQETFETSVNEHDSREEKSSLRTLPISDFFLKRTVAKTETLETPTIKTIHSSGRERKSPVSTKISLSDKSTTSKRRHENFFKPRNETSRGEVQNKMPSTPTRSPQPKQGKTAASTPEPPLSKSSVKESSFPREEAPSSLPLRQRRLSLRARRLDLSSEALKDVGQGFSSTKCNSGHKGLYNLGNTCYINASLQLLFSVPKFIAALAGEGRKLVESTVSLADDLSQKSTKPFVDAKSLKIEMDKRTDKFIGYEQRDAHEFLGDLLDNIHEELVEEERDDGDDAIKTVKPDDDTEATQKHKPDGPQGTTKVEPSEIPITDDFFRLDMMVCLTCQSCGYSRSKKEMYRHLSLDIDYDGDNMTRSVEKSLEKFFEPEDREVNCEKCDEGDRARQTLTIVSRPKALLLHLKRFVFVECSMNGVGGVTLQKNKSSVEIAEVLSLEKFMHKPENGSATSILQQPYSLRGIVHHIGNQATSGHYTADAIRPPTSTDSTPTSSTKPTWVTFDDARTVQTNLKDILSSDTRRKTAYMLMYANA